MPDMLTYVGKTFVLACAKFERQMLFEAVFQCPASMQLGEVYSYSAVVPLIGAHSALLAWFFCS